MIIYDPPIPAKAIIRIVWRIITRRW